jgi:putative ABC transport system ATP-binding protein
MLVAVVPVDLTLKEEIFLVWVELVVTGIIIFQYLLNHSLNRIQLEHLELVGLTKWKHHRPFEMSGGQQQRVAIARAIVTEPSTLFADEPTGNLDSVTTRDIIEILTRLNVDRGITVLMVTHDENVAACAKRRVVIKDGLVESDSTSP